MDFRHSPRSLALQESLRSFIDDHVVPAEQGWLAERRTEPSVPSPTVERLIGEAKRLGLWNMCVRNPSFGPGLSFVDYAPLAEMLGPHRLAQEAVNCDAPSNINADAMIEFGSHEQIDMWVRPQLEGHLKSAFGMTEPDVASSDASNIATTAVRDPSSGSWVLNGRKWYISGVLHPKCAYIMVVANTGPDSARHQRHTQFIVPIGTPGLTVGRNLPKFGYLDDDGHVELELADVVLPDSAILGQVGGGFAIGQARLGPARVQHCMRIIGIAEAALEMICRRVPTRTTFGAAVSTRSNVLDWIGESRIEIEAARLATLRTAWLMDTQGDKASAPNMSQIKVHVTRMATTVLDRAVQIFGAAGVSDDTPLARWYASIRALRIADGPDEVHLMSIARRELRRYES